jgi:hypothetical protein
MPSADFDIAEHEERERESERRSSAAVGKVGGEKVCGCGCPPAEWMWISSNRNLTKTAVLWLLRRNCEAGAVQRENAAGPANWRDETSAANKYIYDRYRCWKGGGRGEVEAFVGRRQLKRAESRE